MGVQTVIILVQAAIILVLLCAALKISFMAKKYSEESRKSQTAMQAARDGWKDSETKRGIELKAREELLDAIASKTHISLPQKPKQAQDSVIRAKSPAHVRQLTEQHFGTKPGDEGEHVN